MTSRFSRQTVVAAIELMESMTHAMLTRYLSKWGPTYIQNVGDQKVGMTNRISNLIQLIDNDPDATTIDGECLRDEIVDCAFPLYGSPQVQGAELTPEQERFRRGLELDGFRISDGAIRRAIPAELRTDDAGDEVSELLKKHGFVVPLGHLKQALQNHKQGHWASANGQIRSFIEGLTDELAVKIDPMAASLPSGENRRAKLASNGFLYVHLNEWSADGKNFSNGLMKRLHPHGSHPGLSDEDDSTFRIQMVVLVARLLLRRFDQLP